MITPQTFFKFYRNITILHEGKHVSVDHVHHDGGVVLKKNNAMDIARLHQLRVHMNSMQNMTPANIRTLISLIMDEPQSDVGGYNVVDKRRSSIHIEYGRKNILIEDGNIAITGRDEVTNVVRNTGLVIMYLIEQGFPIFDVHTAPFRDLIEFSVLY